MNGIEVVGIVTGGFLAVVFISAIFLSFAEEGRASILSSKRLAGFLSLLLGLGMLSFWSYLITKGRGLLIENFNELIAQVSLEFCSASALITAGVALLYNWSKGPLLLMGATTLLLFTTIFSLFSNAPLQDPLVLNGITAVLVIVFSYFVGLVYSWQHFVLKLDEEQMSSQEITKATGVEKAKNSKKAA